MYVWIYEYMNIWRYIDICIITIIIIIIIIISSSSSSSDCKDLPCGRSARARSAASWSLITLHEYHYIYESSKIMTILH